MTAPTMSEALAALEALLAAIPEPDRGNHSYALLTAMANSRAVLAKAKGGGE